MELESEVVWLLKDQTKEDGGRNGLGRSPDNLEEGVLRLKGISVQSHQVGANFLRGYADQDKVFAALAQDIKCLQDEAFSAKPGPYLDYRVDVLVQALPSNDAKRYDELLGTCFEQHLIRKGTEENKCLQRACIEAIGKVAQGRSSLRAELARLVTEHRRELSPLHLEELGFGLAAMDDLIQELAKDAPDNERTALAKGILNAAQAAGYLWDYDTATTLSRGVPLLTQDADVNAKLKKLDERIEEHRKGRRK
ncbi:MAG TPA: hypothetical protein VGP72_12090 [Planctomycetota bacterium]|jgi:hypothetical protein